MPPVATIARAELMSRVLAETRRFRAALPQLLATYSGRWVVFKDGAVRSVHDSMEEAYRAGIRMFGPGGGHVVDCVAERAAAPATAAVVFG